MSDCVCADPPFLSGPKGAFLSGVSDSDEAPVVLNDQEVALNEPPDFPIKISTAV